MSNGKPVRKVVWICKFSNQELIAHFGNWNIKESSPWINGLITLFSNNETVDLHIVAPNVYNNRDLSFRKSGITYHLYKEFPSFIPRKLDRYIRWNYRTGFASLKKKVSAIVDAIQPDIVHLHGAENAYYSAAILPLMDRYKTMVTIQGFIMDSSPEGIDRYVRRERIRVEKLILSKGANFGIECEFMVEKIREFNPGAHFFRHHYPVTIPGQAKDYAQNGEEYDCVFFGRICRDKGIEDLIRAIGLVKRSKPDVTLHVIGSMDNEYADFLNNLCRENGILDNISFTGFMKTQDQLFREALKAKVTVLPTYHDALPGTVVESMFMKIPVIAYNVGGIPELNTRGNAVILVEKGDIEAMAVKITELLNDREYRKRLGESAFGIIHDMIRPDRIAGDILEAYDRIAPISAS